MRWVRRHAFAIASLLLSVAAWLFLYGLALHAASRAEHNSTLSLLRADALAECQRVQGIRDEVNDDSRIIHDVLRGAGYAILHTAPVNRKSRLIGKAYLRFAAQERFHPPTNCALAINEGASYHRPPDQPFPNVR